MKKNNREVLETQRPPHQIRAAIVDIRAVYLLLAEINGTHRGAD